MPVRVPFSKSTVFKMSRFRVNGRPVRQIFHRFQNVPASCERGLKPWQNDWTFALNMHWTNVQCEMLRRFATLSNLVQSCSVMLRAAHSILKAVKNAQWTRLNFFCLKKMFSRFATPLNIVQFAQAHYKCKKGKFRHDGKKWSHQHQLVL